MSAAWAWSAFLACGLAIGLAGPVLVRESEEIARITGLSRSWAGLILLATATSLPELFTGVSAVAAAGAPNIAVGDVLGSCIFNLAMLVVLDALSREEPIYRRIDQGHLLTAAFGIVLLAFVGGLVLLSRNGDGARFLHISGYSPVIVIVYLAAVRAAFVYERRLHATPPDRTEGKTALGPAVLRYLGAAAVVGAAGSLLPFAGVALAETMGLHKTFVGTLLVAGATSLPELIVAVSAMRLGAVDLAIGNLLGSNLFDMLILAADDVAYTKGPLLADVSATHAVSAFAAIAMSGIFIVAVIYRSETRLRGTIGWASISLVAVYLFATYLAYLSEH